MHSFPESEIIISEIKIRNFRSLKEVNVKLHRASILIGENNSGKSSFIDALNAAIGQGAKKFSIEDIFLAKDEINLPRDRHIIIDLCVRPYDPNTKKNTDTFSKKWNFLWGNHIQHDKNDQEFLGIRVDYHWDKDDNEYQYNRASLKEWKDYSDFEEVSTYKPLLSSHIEPISMYLLDAKRDIQDEFKIRSSFWNRLLSDLKLDDTLIQEIESTIGKLNEKIVNESDVLSHIQNQLVLLDSTINLEKDSISINPLTRHVRDLYKGADVTFSTKNAQSFPIANHGMGTRSLATILTFKAYCEWKERKIRESERAVHITIALEEPEVHLHPQAQRALFSQIKQISAQKIISTHSPYIASETNIEDFIFFRKNGDNTVVSQTHERSFSEDETRRINQRIMKTKGELLYSRALLLFEGETERDAIPIYAEKYWHKIADCHGISMLDVRGDDYYPFLALAKLANIPWYIFSDGEVNSLRRISDNLAKIGEDPVIKNHNNIVHLPDNKNYEKYMVCPLYRETIRSVIISIRKQNEKHEVALKMEWQSKSDTELISELEKNKTKYAKPIAEAIVKLPSEELCIPRKIRDIFDTISNDCKLGELNEV
jgi:putative ATP-dependent endonuclease of OLD family